MAVEVTVGVDTTARTDVVSSTLIYIYVQIACNMSTYFKHGNVLCFIVIILYFHQKYYNVITISSYYNIRYCQYYYYEFLLKPIFPGNYLTYLTSFSTITAVFLKSSWLHDDVVAP